MSDDSVTSQRISSFADAAEIQHDPDSRQE